MAGTLSQVLVNTRLASALEDRAFREGLLTQSDVIESDFVRLKPKPAVVDKENATLDLVMLYDTVIGSGGSMRPDALNDRLGEGVLQARAPMVRRVSLAVSEVGEVYRERMFSREELGDVRSVDVDGLKAAAAHEAMTLIARDIGDHLASFRAHYDAQVVRSGWRDVFASEPMVHAPCARAIAYNVGTLLDLCDRCFCGGDDAHEIDEGDIEVLVTDPDLRRRLLRLMSDGRFRSYFGQLQDLYFDAYDGSFTARLLGHEVAYDVTPAKPMISSRETELHHATGLIRVNLADVADRFPLPRTIEEAVEFRGHPRVKAFRAALEEWIDSFDVGPALEGKMRREVSLAGRDLGRLASIRSLKERPLVFGVKMAAGFVPIAGSPVTALIDTIDYFYERALKKRHAWIIPTRATRLD